MTSRSYPDGTSDSVVYNLLDARYLFDRLGRMTDVEHDAFRRVSSVTDPAGRTTQYGYCICGALNQITDPLGNVTEWNLDLEKRTLSKSINGLTAFTNTYENTTSRLKTVSDAMATPQVTTYGYFLDDTGSMLKGSVLAFCHRGDGKRDGQTVEAGPTSLSGRSGPDVSRLATGSPTV